MSLRFIDFFAGIGSTRRGLENAGHTCVGYVEWDKWARKSYEAIFDTKGEWSAYDISEVRSSELPRADIWTFGFPCQDLSVAGKREGFAGNRSSHFFTVMGLARELKEEDRPEWLIAENVMGFLSSNHGYDFLAAQVAMDEIGYDVEWEVFNATQFGIPQNRQRIFLVGHLRSRGRRKVFPLSVNDGKTVSGLKMIGLLDMKGNECIRRVYDPTGCSPTLTTMAGGHREPKIQVRACLTPDREKRQQGRRFKDPGEPAFTVNTQDRHGVAVIRNRGEWSERETAQRLDANYWKGIDNHGARTAITDGVRIRKLTPRECWRLMGREDWEFDRARDAGVSDTQLYKQAGNSLIPQIIEAIGLRIAEVSREQKEAA